MQLYDMICILAFVPSEWFFLLLFFDISFFVWSRHHVYRCSAPVPVGVRADGVVYIGLHLDNPFTVFRDMSRHLSAISPPQGFPPSCWKTKGQFNS